MGDSSNKESGWDISEKAGEVGVSPSGVAVAVDTPRVDRSILRCFGLGSGLPDMGLGSSKSVGSRFRLAGRQDSGDTKGCNMACHILDIVETSERDEGSTSVIHALHVIVRLGRL